MPSEPLLPELTAIIATGYLRLKRLDFHKPTPNESNPRLNSPSPLPERGSDV